MEIKRSIMLKCIPEENIDSLYNNFGFYVSKTLQHIKEIHEQFEKIEFIKGYCESCCHQEKGLTYQYKESREKVCTSCFMRNWSQFTLQSDFKQSLTKLEPKFAMHGYYYGAIIIGIDIVKSYLKKKEKRDREIAKAKENCITLNAQLEGFDGLNFQIEKTKAAIRKGAMLNKELAQLEKEKEQTIREFRQSMKRAKRKSVAFPIYRNNQIYFGSTGMFKFDKIENGYNMLISDYKIPKHKILFKLKIGDLRKYHKKCKSQVEIKEGIFNCQKCGFVPKLECYLNFQEQFILKCIEKKQEKIVYPKMIRRKVKNGYEHYFMLPARDNLNVMEKKEDIEKFIKKNKSIEFCCLSFGIKNPITLIIVKNNKITNIKTFGDGILYDKGEFERKVRADFYNGISQKYAHNHPHKKEDKELHQHKRKSLFKANKKIGFRHQRFVNYYNQKLTYEIITYIKENCTTPLIIFKDTKNIKDISYKGELMRRLSRWSIEQQKVFLTYKSYLNEIPIYLLPYKEVSQIKCWKCNSISKEKVTTQLLNFENRFVCENCKYNYNFNVVDAFNLSMKINEIIKKEVKA